MDPQTKSTIVQKIVTAPENSAMPTKGSAVKLRAWLSNEQKQNGLVNNFRIGQSQLNSNLEEVVLQMKVGDIWKVKTYDNLNQKEQILFLELIQQQKCQEKEDSHKGANVRAQQSKKLGNGYIKDKKYAEAIEQYTKAYDLIQYACDKQAVQLRLSLISNLALATLNLSHFRQCIEWCRLYQNESVQPNKKVLYRQAQALKGQKQWKKSKQSIARALQLLKSDQQAVNDFTALKQVIQKEQKVEVAKQKNFYGKMLG